MRAEAFANEAVTSVRIGECYYIFHIKPQKITKNMIYILTNKQTNN